nr:MAG TPA: hypothetical protein [Caudoviricetes sp.]
MYSKWEVERPSFFYCILLRNLIDTFMIFVDNWIRYNIIVQAKGGKINVW